jgi:hypothetical protein
VKASSSDEHWLAAGESLGLSTNGVFGNDGRHWADQAGRLRPRASAFSQVMER